MCTESTNRCRRRGLQNAAAISGLSCFPSPSGPPRQWLRLVSLLLLLRVSPAPPPARTLTAMSPAATAATTGATLFRYVFLLPTLRSPDEFLEPRSREPLVPSPPASVSPRNCQLADIHRAYHVFEWHK
ncbi:hypothetical protein ABZP36_016785 [Zizania latifolia]